jgi:hypothetical protein
MQLAFPIAIDPQPASFLLGVAWVAAVFPYKDQDANHGSNETASYSSIMMRSSLNDEDFG